MIKKRLKIIVVTLIVFSLGITYSVFQSTAEIYIEDQSIAKFIFNTEKVSEIDLPIIDIKPGESKEYLFSVANNLNDSISDVSFEYQITIKTYHFAPFEITLYKNDELIGVCDESYSRNENKELICNMPVVKLDHIEEINDSYKLLVSFPVEYSDSVYAGLVDYINLEIKSWQLLRSSDLWKD